jgi:DNA replication protein DnaC
MRCASCVSEEEARTERERHEQLCRERLAALVVPSLYGTVTFENFEIHGDAESRAALARALEYAKAYVVSWPNAPVISVFSGACGTGKGHLVWSIAKRLAGERAVLSRVVVLSDVIRDLREAWGTHESGPSEAQRLAKYRSPEFLTVDEVSRHAFFGQPQQHLYDLIAWREERQKPTILTTNDRGEELVALLGPAISSRAAGWRGFIDFGGADYRVSYGLRR